METITKKDNKIVFSMDLDESLANAIRRYVNQVQTIAIDEVDISKNDSPLYDETLAHRMGLIPLKASTKVNAEGKLKTKKEGFVYSGEIEGIDVVYDKIPLTLLNKNQEVDIKIRVRKGHGEEHSKFSPGFIFYREASEVEMDKSVLDEVKSVCPDAEVKEKGGKIVVADNKEKEVCDVCEGICDKEGKEISIKPTGELIITVETYGQLKAEDIFKKSIESLKKDLEEVAKKIK